MLIIASQTKEKHEKRKSCGISHLTTWTSSSVVNIQIFGQPGVLKQIKYYSGRWILGPQSLGPVLPDTKSYELRIEGIILFVVHRNWYGAAILSAGFQNWSKKDAAHVLLFGHSPPHTNSPLSTLTGKRTRRLHRGGTAILIIKIHL